MRLYMQRSTSLFFVRHGQTEWNKIRKMQGQIDTTISEIGIAQAQAVAQYLAEHSFDAIVSSDLQRAVQTAVIINEYHKHDIKLEPLLREQHYGIAQGMSVDELASGFQVTAKTLNQLEQEYCVPESETYAQLVDRVVNAITSIIQTYQYQTILIVTHHNVIRSLIRHAFNNHQLPVSVENCGIAQFDYDTELIFKGFVAESGRIGLE